MLDMSYSKYSHLIPSILDITYSECYNMIISILDMTYIYYWSTFIQWEVGLDIIFTSTIFPKIWYLGFSSWVVGYTNYVILFIDALVVWHKCGVNSLVSRKSPIQETNMLCIWYLFCVLGRKYMIWMNHISSLIPKNRTIIIRHIINFTNR